MYIPSHYKQHDRDAAIAFMQAHPFATVVSSKDGIPTASHLPCHIELRGEEISMTAHFAKANPQWKGLDEVLVIFGGPHAYISPAHYERVENVPTWNYIAMHAYGKASIITEDKEGMAILEDLIRQSEPAYLAQWNGLSPEYKARMYRGIVPFRVQVTRLEAKHKLSQNKTAGERSNIIKTLLQSPDGTARELASYMQAQES